ncbi:hypothetical protein G7054_g5150 [Neopestalotiopsis clavispora]|nr:hypothetical protein G7054_g5150 [Neopestalotiopsis clavispora]
MAPITPSPPLKRGILGLPQEILKEICSHCSQCDLICLALVCRQFHELAASQLYRIFHIVFPDEDDPTFDSPIDGLASGLDTFVTSEYNYAKHLRDLSLDTLSAGGRAEQAYRPYLYKVSCGKFMNTLLLLTLRKATSLEAFRWNIRVELSRPVFKALHNITSLKHLQIRMQSGYSLWEAPPPLPWTASFSVTSGTDSSADATWTSNAMPTSLYSTGVNVPLPSTFNTVPGTAGPFGLGVPQQYTTYAPPPVMPPSAFGSHVSPPTPSLKPPFKAKGPRKQTNTKEPPTLAGFKKLQTLCVLDIDNLDIVPEIQTCIQNSSSQLRKLKLSFSDALALQARKPKVEVDPNESDEDDEFEIVPITSNNYDDGTSPAKAFRAHEERKAQELVLGHIFQVESYTTRTVQLARKSKRKISSEDPADAALGRRQKMFLSAIQEVSKKLSTNTAHLASDLSKQKELLEVIMTASKLYIDDVEKDIARPSQKSTTSPESWRSEAQPGPSQNVGPEEIELAEEHADLGDPIKEPVKASAQLREKNDDTVPEDIDIAKPEETLHDDPAYESPDEPTPRNEPSVPSTAVPTPSATNSSHGTPYHSHSNSTAPSVIASKEGGESSDNDQTSLIGKEQSEKSPSPAETKQQSLEDIQHEINIMEAELEDAGESTLHIQHDDEELRRQVSEYTRETRGIALRSLSIHLVPLKASVLGRAIDLRSLTRITLLNVGNQAPIWTLMAKENKVKNLPLCKIFTDNVSPSFLHFASQLESIQELFLLERGLKYKPESFAPRTEITLEQIRRAILKKHMSSIKRLMIKNQMEGDSSWDMDEKTMQLIGRRGRQLEELAVATGIRAIHAFLQYLAGLVNLRALHVLSFRVDDTCLSVMRETRRFIVDTVSHYPEMRLEWIAMGDDNRLIALFEEPTARGNSKRRTRPAHRNVLKDLLYMDVVLDIVILMTREWRFVFARGIMVADYVLQLH